MSTARSSFLKLPIPSMTRATTKMSSARPSLKLPTPSMTKDSPNKYYNSIA